MERALARASPPAPRVGRMATTSPLRLAAVRNDVAKVTTLLAQGAPLEVLDVRGFTPLQAALAVDGTDAAQALLRAAGARLHSDAAFDVHRTSRSGTDAIDRIGEAATQPGVDPGGVSFGPLPLVGALIVAALVRLLLERLLLRPPAAAKSTKAPAANSKHHDKRR